MPDPYADLDTLKLALAGRAAGSSTALAMDDGRDDLLNNALAAASRSIDAHCGRVFYLDATATQRTFNPTGRIVRTREGQKILLDDIGSTTGLIIEIGSASTWTAITDYEAQPDNAIARGLPITSLIRTSSYWTYGPPNRIRVTAKWGWPAVPDVVVQATLLQAARLYRRKDSPEGVVGNAEWGVVRLSRIDPDVQALVAHLVLPGIA